MKAILKSLVVSLLLALFSNTTLAQCPGGKTAVIWVNGVLVPSAGDWSNTVSGLKTNFINAHPNLTNCVEFDFSYNTSHGFRDFVQSLGQWTLEGLLSNRTSPTGAINLLTAFQNYTHVIALSDPDLGALVSRISNWSTSGYNVVLVGHSQGTYYTNFAYEAIRYGQIVVPNMPPLPNPKLTIVNIASPADHVADARQKYTTQCSDIILLVPGSLPSNINNTIVPCPIAVPPLWFSHELEPAYMSVGLNTQQQIYAHLEDSLPDPGCTGDSNCYLKDNFSDGIYTNNFEQVFLENIANSLDSTIQETSGMLKLTSFNVYPPVIVYVGADAWKNPTGPARLSLRSRRVFTGQFTASMQYNSFGNSGTNSIQLVNPVTNTIAAYWTLAPIPNNTTWYNLSYTKTDTQIKLFVNGVLSGTWSSSPTDGYYLLFDLKQNNTLQIKNLSVTLPTGTVAITTTNNVPVSCSLNGTSITAPTTLTNQYIGTKTLTCSAPSGYTLNSVTPTSQTLTAGGTANFAVNLTAVSPSMTLTPATNSVSAVRGVNSATVNLTLTSQNGMTGNPTLALYCSGTCPSGFSYSYTNGSSRTLPANGTIPISVTFIPSSSATLGTSNFEYWATLNGMTKKATIAVTVTAPTTGSIKITVVPDANTTHSSTFCSVNNEPGVNITYAPVTLTGQTPGSKTLACTFIPGVYMFDYISPSITQTLSAGQTINFTVNLKLTPVLPTPVLSSLTVNSPPRVNTAINVSLFGTNFSSGSQGYVCTSSSTSSCVATNTSYFSSTQVRFTNVRSSVPATLYLRVTNSPNAWSNYLTMVVTN